MPLSDSMGATLGGQMGVRGGAGGGAVLAGVRRVLDPATTVDAHAQARRGVGGVLGLGGGGGSGASPRAHTLTPRHRRDVPSNPPPRPL